jgi:hypothetical protein
MRSFGCINIPPSLQGLRAYRIGIRVPNINAVLLVTSSHLQLHLVLTFSQQQSAILCKAFLNAIVHPAGQVQRPKWRF